MTDLLDIKADDSVLEIGTGLGYQTAVLAQLARKVYSVEIIEELGQEAKRRLRQQGCSNVELTIANGYHGWSQHAPARASVGICPRLQRSVPSVSPIRKRRNRSRLATFHTVRVKTGNALIEQKTSA
jgi:protein-L-isoaspartate(D-aspartate) O-methyltransferase